MASASRKILLLGSSCLVGDVARLLGERGEWSTVVVAGSSACRRANDARPFDPLRRGASRRLAKLLAELGPAVLVHLYVSESPVSPRREEGYDTAIAREVAAALRLWARRGGRLHQLLVLSSTAAYGVARGSPLVFGQGWQDREETGRAAGPWQRWTEQLREMERVLRSAATEISSDLLIMRAACVVAGPMASPLCDYLASPWAVRVLGYDPPVQALHYEDLLEALVRGVGQRLSATVNVVGHGVMPLSRFAAAQGKLLLPLPGPLARRLAPAALGYDALRWRSLADESRAIQLLGFRPRPIEEAVLEA